MSSIETSTGAPATHMTAQRQLVEVSLLHSFFAPTETSRALGRAFLG